MVLRGRVGSIASDERRAFLFIFFLAVVARFVVWRLIPVDWNSDSYHHWQISYLTLKIGLLRGRMYDLNGCELYWGMVPHLVQAVLLGAFFTSSLLPLRVFNALLGSVNAFLVYLIGRKYYGDQVGFYAGISFSLFPVAAVFDVLAMQETIALAFALISVYLFTSRPGWSGFFLALACQSRIEYWLVSILFVVEIAFIKRWAAEVQAFALCWLGVMGVFCSYFRFWTSNPVYPFYWSLFSVFKGWERPNLGVPFHTLMFNWIHEKSVSWLKKPTGLFLLGAFLLYIAVFVLAYRRRRESSPILLFFLNLLVVFSPLFVPYYPKQIDNLLLMLRESIPIDAIGLVLVCRVIERLSSYTAGLFRRVPLELFLGLVILSSHTYFIPAYSRFQVDSQLCFRIADGAIRYYEGGTIVCDHPTINYRFVSEWGVGARSLLGNHYSPDYYHVTNPAEYARWFERHNITLWLYVDNRAYPVWTVVDRNLPGLLVFRDEVLGVRVYAVDHDVLDRLLSE
jgi:hypothetical protein